MMKMVLKERSPNAARDSQTVPQEVIQAALFFIRAQPFASANACRSEQCLPGHSILPGAFSMSRSWLLPSSIVRFDKSKFYTDSPGSFC